MRLWPGGGSRHDDVGDDDDDSDPEAAEGDKGAGLTWEVLRGLLELLARLRVDVTAIAPSLVALLMALLDADTHPGGPVEPRLQPPLKYGDCGVWPFGCPAPPPPPLKQSQRQRD